MENLIQHELTFKVAGPDDLPDIFRLVDAYDDGMAIDRTRAKNSLREFVYMQGVFIIKKDENVIGGIAGYAAQSMFTDDTIFNVMFFYILPEFRKYTKRVILEMELILLTTKATQIVFGIPATARMVNLYRFFKIIGYKPLEIHVTRLLSSTAKDEKCQAK